MPRYGQPEHLKASPFEQLPQEDFFSTLAALSPAASAAASSSASPQLQFLHARRDPGSAGPSSPQPPVTTFLPAGTSVAASSSSSSTRSLSIRSFTVHFNALVAEGSLMGADDWKSHSIKNEINESSTLQRATSHKVRTHAPGRCATTNLTSPSFAAITFINPASWRSVTTPCPVCLSEIPSTRSLPLDFSAASNTIHSTGGKKAFRKAF